MGGVAYRACSVRPSMPRSSEDGEADELLEWI